MQQQGGRDHVFQHALSVASSLKAAYFLGVDLKENRFSSVATGSIAGFLRLFLDAQGSVAAEGRLSSGKPVPSKFQLKLLAGKWSDEVGIVFTSNRAKESVLPSSASPSADYVPIK